MGLKRFVIERDIPTWGRPPTKTCQAPPRASNSALAKLAPRVQWEHSYVTADKTFCVYLAEDEADIREHAELSGFPATTITPVEGLIDPTTGS